VGGEFERLPDGIHHVVEVFHYLVVPKPHDPKTLRLQPCCPARIRAGLRGVLTAIEFQNQPDFKANEIDDVVSNWGLPAEFSSFQLAATKLAP
jgi:hypothetical protein